MEQLTCKMIRDTLQIEIPAERYGYVSTSRYSHDLVINIAAMQPEEFQALADTCLEAIK